MVSARQVPIWLWGLLGSLSLGFVVVMIIFVQRYSAEQTALRQKRLEQLAADEEIRAADFRRASLAKEEAERAEREARAKRMLEVKTTYAADSPQSRALGIRECFLVRNCKQDEVDAIVAAGASEKEQAKLRAASFGLAAGDIAANAADGTKVSVNSVAAISVILDQQGTAFMDTMDKTTAREAMKDPAGNRGRVMSVSGSVIELRKSGTYYEGAIMTSSGTVVRTFTPLSTKVVSDEWATFKGVFVQEYNYPNVSGGQSRSLLLVGAFSR